MLKKVILSILVLTVVSAVGIALLDGQNNVSDQSQLQQEVGQGLGNGSRGVNRQAVAEAGEVWSGSGTISALDDVGMTLTLDDGIEAYIELGSPGYWQAQDVSLSVGETVTVNGFFNGTNYHAGTVTTTSGQTLAVRDANGKPLWSGQGSNGGQGEGQIPADEWEMIEGLVTTLTNNGLVIAATDGQTLNISFGKSGFWQTQNISFSEGDTISMRGFWQGSQFHAGQVTKTATGEQILLRDPNGRPLWAGPGRTQQTTSQPAQ